MLKDPSSHEDPNRVWTHTKGGLYVILHHALLERDLTPMVVYRSLKAIEPVWIRTAEQFFDGRFRNGGPM